MVKTSPGTETIEEDVRAARDDIDEKVDRLQRRLSPGEIFDSVIEFARTNGGAVAGGVGRTVRDHPLPLAMIGAGIVWLALSRRGGGDAGEAIADSGEGLGERLRHQAEGVRERVRDTTEHLSERAGEMGHRAREQASQLGRSSGDFVKEHPVLVGAAGLVLGAALAATLPRTTRESDAFGERAERTRQAARDAAVKQGRKVQEAAKSAVEKARETAERKAPDADELKRDAENVARAAGGAQPGGSTKGTPGTG